MKWIDIRDKTKKELQDLLAEKRADLQALRFQAHGRQLKQVHKIADTRKLIARITTALRSKADTTTASQ